MAGSGAEVEEERLLAVDVAEVAQVLDGVVDQVFGEVVALGHGARRLHRVVVAVEGGHELVRLAAVEPVPTIEAPAERPAAAVGPHVGLVVGREVPLPDRVGRVALGAQDLGEEAVLGRDLAVVPGVAHRQVGDAAHAVRVVVAAREQARPRGRAQRRGVEVGQPDPRRRQRVDVGGLDDRAVATELRVADVVEHEVHHVGRADGRLRLAAATPASSHASRDRSPRRSRRAPPRPLLSPPRPNCLLTADRVNQE